MEFQKKVWQFENIISETELNRMEHGIEEGITKAEAAETPEGATQKAAAALEAANEYTDQEVGEVAQVVGQVQQDFVGHQADYVLQIPYATATGSANTYAVTLNPALTAYSDGVAIAVKINVNNTGASTININSLGAKSIRDSKGSVLTSGKLLANSIYTLRYNGTNFILQGEGASGNATASDLLSGKTATVDAGEIAGTMPNRGTNGFTPTTTAITIPEGYYNGTGQVASLGGNAVAGDVLTGKLFSSDSAGRAIEGMMPNRGAVNIIPSTVNQAITNGYHSGSGVVYGSANLQAGNIKDGVNIFGVVGNFVGNSPIIQHGITGIVNGDTTRDITIAPVNLSRAIIMLTTNINSDDGHLDRHSVSAHFVNNTTIRFTRVSIFGITDISWQVIEFPPGVSVQSGTLDITNTSHFVTISPINVSKSYLIYSAHIGGNNVFRYYTYVRSSINSTNELHFYRRYSVNSPSYTLRWFVVTFN